ncbi:MAG: CBS domain-containing protein [Pirellulaceae bacterium]
MADIVRAPCPRVRPDDRIDAAVEQMQSSDCPGALVESNGTLVGILTLEHLGDWLTLHLAWQERRAESRFRAPRHKVATAME